MAEHESSIGATDEWYTPPELFEALDLRFDLDPCSPGQGHWVPAARIYTKEDDGLAQAPDKRDAQREAENLDQLAATDARIVEIDQELAAKFPDHAALASPAPLTVEEVQSLLHADEALVFFLDTQDWKPTPEETFIWVVTKTDMRWVRSELGTEQLKRAVKQLRCGLDLASWDGYGALECLLFLKIPADRAPKDGELLPFDLARAHALYKALFGEVEDLLKGKSLLIVPSGPLTQLPFQVLVTVPPTSGDYKTAAWLVRDHTLAVLPAVSSLKALRGVVHPSTATKPMIGFGDPLLDGPDDRYAGLAKLARNNQSCATPAGQQLALASEPRGGMAQVERRGGFADVSFLRKQVPLPETADELCAVARDLHANLDEIRLGARATEREVKRLSESGQLARYRIVHAWRACGPGLGQ